MNSNKKGRKDMGSHFDRIVSFLGPLGVILNALPEQVKDRVFDIRIRKEGPIFLYTDSATYFLRADGRVTEKWGDKLYICSASQIHELFLQCCGQSVFSHENEIKNGYISLGDNYRVGICGTAVIQNNEIKTIKNILSLVFRIPREINGCADELFEENLDFTKGLLIVGPPSSGKTTFLKDIIRSLTSGRYGFDKRVVVLDEKGELRTQEKENVNADYLRGYPKEAGFETAIRLLSPDFLISDELSSYELDAVKRSVFAGVPLISSVHGSCEDFLKRTFCKELMETGAFGNTVFLEGRKTPGKIKLIERV